MMKFQNICVKACSVEARDKGRENVNNTFETPDRSEAKYRRYSAFEKIKRTRWYQDRTRISPSGILFLIRE
jgi:hypothetical protein